MSNKIAKLKALIEAQESKGSDYEKFDYTNRRLKTPAVGELRLRILENVDEEDVFFYSDFMHKVDDSTYIDCKGPKSGCKVCAVQDADLWDEKDELKKSAYRLIKRTPRNTIQVAILDKDGLVSDEYPKLFTPAKTLMALIMDYVDKNSVDVSDVDTPIDLLVVKEKDDRFYTYKNSKFIAANPKCDLSTMEDKIALTADKWYNDSKALPIIKKMVRMFDLDVDTSEWSKTTGSAPVESKVVSEEGMDEFEKALMKEIDDA